MERLIPARSRKLKPATSKASRKSISLPELEDGPSRSASPGFLIAAPYGQQAAPVRLSPSPVSESHARRAQRIALSRALRGLASSYVAYAATHGLPIKDTSCPSFGDSFAMPDPIARSLASRLRERMAVYGSPLYELRWKSWTMILGARICALRASEKIISGSGFTGWPTPNTPNGGRGTGHVEDWRGATAYHNGKKVQVGLESASKLVGWTTPQSHDSTGPGKAERLNRHGKKHGNRNLNDQATLAGWATPPVQDSANDAGPSQWERRSKPLNVEVKVYTSDAQTENTDPSRPTKGASLNPYFSLYLLLGPFAIAWGSCGERVMRSTRKSRRNGSEPAKKS